MPEPVANPALCSTRRSGPRALAIGAPGLLLLAYVVALVSSYYRRGGDDCSQPSSVVIHVLMDPSSRRESASLLGIQAAVRAHGDGRIHVHDVRPLRRGAPAGSVLSGLSVPSKHCLSMLQRSVFVGPFNTTDTAYLLDTLVDDPGIASTISDGRTGCVRVRPLFLLGNVTMSIPNRDNSARSALARQLLRFSSPSNDELAEVLISALPPEARNLLILQESGANREYGRQIRQALHRGCALWHLACKAHEYSLVPSSADLADLAAMRPDAVVVLSSGEGASIRTARGVLERYAGVPVIVTDTWSATELRAALSAEEQTRTIQVALEGGHRATSGSDPIELPPDDRYSALIANRLAGFRRYRFSVGYNVGRAATMVARGDVRTEFVGISFTCGPLATYAIAADLSRPVEARARLLEPDCHSELKFAARGLGVGWGL